MINKIHSLRSHFLLLYVVLAVLSGVVVPTLSVFFSVNTFRNYQIQRRQADIENLSESLTQSYREEGGIWKRRRVMDILRPAPQWAGMRISLFDANNHEVFTLKPMQPIHQRNRNNDKEEPESNSESEHLTIQLGRSINQNIGRLEIERKLPSGRYEMSFISYLRRYTLYGALIMIAIACGLGYFVAGRLSRPVINAIERTKNISHGEYDSNQKFKKIGIRELDDLTIGVEDLGRSLAEQEKLRRRLMIDVAHELRTPLTVIKTQIEAIADGILEPTQERLNLCLNEMNRFADLIGNVDALSRLEGEIISMHKENTDMKKFLEYVTESFKPVFSKQNINLSGNFQENCKCEIDRDAMRHVIDNLLSNALRYTNEGGQVSVNLSKQNKNIIISVKDTGIGISQEDLPNIFERFYRADESRARVTGGSGVGLAIVKAAIEAHGGKITVESQKGIGSCFTITLPES